MGAANELTAKMMNDQRKTKKQLLEEIEELRKKVAFLEKSQSKKEDESEVLRIIRNSTPIGLFITQDGKLSAHYENTCVIREGAPEILTLLKGE